MIRRYQHKMPPEYKPPEYKPSKICLKLSISPGLQDFTVYKILGTICCQRGTHCSFLLNSTVRVFSGPMVWFLKKDTLCNFEPLEVIFRANGILHTFFFLKARDVFHLVACLRALKYKHCEYFKWCLIICESHMRTLSRLDFAFFRGQMICPP